MQARAERQQRVMDLLEDAGPQGMTWYEIGVSEGWHHGQASGALSNLHKDGLISRLAERRSKSKIYVRNKYVIGRELSPYKSNKPLAEENEVLRQEIERLRAAGDRLAADIRSGRWDDALDAWEEARRG